MVSRSSGHRHHDTPFLTMDEQTGRSGDAPAPAADAVPPRASKAEPESTTSSGRGNGDGPKDACDACELGRIGVPDGGSRAWLVVLGSFVNFTMGLGLMNSFGTFLSRYEGKWVEVDTSAVTWIGSVQLFILFVGGLFVGPAFDMFGARRLMQLGTACCFASSLLSSWSTTYWHYLVVQGILFGTANALLFYPAISAISEWFNEKRALALGIAVAGSSVGGIVWPVVINALYRSSSEDVVHRVIAIISAPPLLLSCYLVRERKGVAGHDTCGNPAHASERSLSKAVLDKHFLALSGCLLVLYCGMLVPFYYIPLYGVENGASASMSDTLLAVAYSGSFVGRIGAGWLADRFGRFNMLSLIGALTSVVTCCWIWMTSIQAMIAFAVLFGLFSGGLMPLGSACVAQTTPDMGHIGLRIGTMMAISSLGALAGGPVSGIIRAGPHGWLGVHIFAAAVGLLGALLVFAVRLWHARSMFARV